MGDVIGTDWAELCRFGIVCYLMIDLDMALLPLI
jgi:hypothetical protein